MHPHDRKRLTAALLAHPGVAAVIRVEADADAVVAHVVPVAAIAFGYPEAFELAVREHVSRALGAAPPLRVVAVAGTGA